MIASLVGMVGHRRRGVRLLSVIVIVLGPLYIALTLFGASGNWACHFGGSACRGPS